MASAGFPKAVWNVQGRALRGNRNHFWVVQEGATDMLRLPRDVPQMQQGDEGEKEVVTDSVDMALAVYKTFRNTFLPLSDPRHKKRKGKHTAFLRRSR